MEQITRHIVKLRGETELIYEFTTFDFILTEEFWEKAAAFHPNFRSLCRNLKQAFQYGLPHRDKSASGAKRLTVAALHMPDHEFSALAKESGCDGQSYAAHKICQKHFMKNHRLAIAMEMPAWTPEMSCLIDIVLFDPSTGMVYLLDYKPMASYEKKAATQLWHDRKIFCHFTGIDPKFVECYYFDGQNTYKLIS